MPNTRRVETLIIGAGFAGLSTAYHLSKNGARGILLLEREGRSGAHASGNNAGMIRQAISDPIIARLAYQGRRALAAASRRGWSGIRYRENGSLLTGKGRTLAELDRIALQLRKNHLPYRFLSSKDMIGRVPVLKGADLTRGLFCPSDAFLDIEALMDGFVKHLKKSGVRLGYNTVIRAIRPVKGGFEVRSQNGLIFARRIINCAGAWAGELGRVAGASLIPFKAYRRHLFFSRGSKLIDRDWPFVWDLTHEVYFRPYGRRFMMSPCDKKLFEPKGSLTRREKADPRMKAVLLRKLTAFVPRLASQNPVTRKVGLRTMAPDGRFVIGEDPKLKNFFWVAGLGGHGVTTSFSVGKLAADLILNLEVDLQIRKALSPARFGQRTGDRGGMLRPQFEPQLRTRTERRLRRRRIRPPAEKGRTRSLAHI